MIKCVCGCDPEVCACAFQQFHIPPPDEWDDDFEPSDLEEEGEEKDD